MRHAERTSPLWARVLQLPLALLGLASIIATGGNGSSGTGGARSAQTVDVFVKSYTVPDADFAIARGVAMPDGGAALVGTRMAMDVAGLAGSLHVIRVDGSGDVQWAASYGTSQIASPTFLREYVDAAEALDGRLWIAGLDLSGAAVAGYDPAGGGLGVTSLGVRDGDEAIREIRAIAVTPDGGWVVGGESKRRDSDAPYGWERAGWLATGGGAGARLETIDAAPDRRGETIGDIAVESTTTGFRVGVTGGAGFAIGAGPWIAEFASDGARVEGVRTFSLDAGGGDGYGASIVAIRPAGTAAPRWVAVGHRSPQDITGVAGRGVAFTTVVTQVDGIGVMDRALDSGDELVSYTHRQVHRDRESPGDFVALRERHSAPQRFSLVAFRLQSNNDYIEHDWLLYDAALSETSGDLRGKLPNGGAVTSASVDGFVQLSNGNYLLFGTASPFGRYSARVDHTTGVVISGEWLEISDCGNTRRVRSTPDRGALVIDERCVHRFNSAGQFVRTLRTQSAPTALARARSARATPDGGLYVVANVAESTWLLRLEPSGTIRWQKLIPDVSAVDLETVGDGLVLLGRNSLLLRVSADGEITWRARFPQLANIYRIADDGDGFVVQGLSTLARFDGAGNLLAVRDHARNLADARPTSDGGTIVLYANGTLEKRTSTGATEWQASFVAARAGQPEHKGALFDVKSTADGGYVAAGSADDPEQYLCFTTRQLETLRGCFNLWILRVDARGAPVWSREIATGGDDGLGQVDLEVLPDGGFLVATGTNGYAFPRQSGLLVRLDANGNVTPGCVAALTTVPRVRPGVSGGVAELLMTAPVPAPGPAAVAATFLASSATSEIETARSCGGVRDPNPPVAPPAPTFAVTVEQRGSGTGPVTSTPAGIVCGTAGTQTCTANFTAGSTAYLRIDEGAVSRFLDWQGCDVVTGRNREICEIAVDRDRTVGVVFDAVAPQRARVTFTAVSGSGRVVDVADPSRMDCGSGAQGRCAFEYPACPTTRSCGPGERIAFEARPVTGGTFLGWGGDCAGQSAAAQLTLAMDRNWQCSAEFAPLNVGSLAVNVQIEGVDTAGTPRPAGRVLVDGGNGASPLECVDGQTSACTIGTEPQRVVTLTALPRAPDWGFTRFDCRAVGRAGFDHSRPDYRLQFVANPPVGVTSIDCTASFDDNLRTLRVEVPDQGARNVRIVDDHGLMDCLVGPARICHATERATRQVTIEVAEAIGIFDAWRGCDSVIPDPRPPIGVPPQQVPPVCVVRLDRDRTVVLSIRDNIGTLVGVWEQVGATVNTGSPPTEVLGAPAIVLDPDDNPTVAYNEDRLIRVRRWNGAWQDVGSAVNAGTRVADDGAPSLGRLPDGTLYVAWADGAGPFAGEPRDVRVARYESGVWQPVGPSLDDLPTADAHAPVLALRAGRPIVAWVEDNAVVVKLWTGTSWATFGGGSPGASGSTDARVRLAVGGNAAEDVYVAWVDPQGDVRLAKSTNGTAWQPQGGPAFSASFTPIALGMDENGSPFIARGTDQVEVRRWTGGSWQDVGTPLRNGGVGAAVRDVATSPTNFGGFPLIAWASEFRGLNQRYDVHRWNGQAWQAVGHSIAAEGRNLASGFAMPASIADGPRPTIVFGVRVGTADTSVHVRQHR